jgi:hypothetical protein
MLLSIGVDVVRASADRNNPWTSVNEISRFNLYVGTNGSGCSMRAYAAKPWPKKIKPRSSQAIQILLSSKKTPHLPGFRGAMTLSEF